VYHVEIRQFPHNVSRFNLGDPELWAIVEPWVREKAVELGERNWSPHQAELTILEGPHLSLQQLSLGRGWRNAERSADDVTERVLERAREVVDARDAGSGAESGAAGGSAAAPAAELPADSLAVGVELASLLGAEPGRLLAAWKQIAGRASGLSPSESLALAEREISAPSSQPGR
jgi:hypothetical protein